MVSRVLRSLPLRCCRFAAAGFLLSGIFVQGQFLPIPLAFLCAQDFCAETVCAYLGCAAGYLLFLGTAAALEPLAAGFLMLAGLCLFRGLLPSDRRWFQPSAGAALYAAVGLIFLLQAPLTLSSVLLYVLRAALIAGFGTAFQGAHRTELLLYALLAGFCRIPLPGRIPLGAVFSACLICLTLCTGRSLRTAVLCGLLLDLCRPSQLSAAMIFSAAALAARAPRHLPKLPRILLFVCTCAAFVLLSDGLEARLYLAAFSGALLAALVPHRLAVRFLGHIVSNGSSAALPPSAEALDRAAATLASLSQTFTRPAVPQSDPSPRSSAGLLRRQYEARLQELRTMGAEQLRILSRMLRSLAQPEQAAPARFRPELAVRQSARQGGVSGDHIEHFTYGGCFYLLLCDGMGTGSAAAQEAADDAALLRQLIESGCDAQDALQMLNLRCIFRGDGGFSAVDLAQIDLSSGEGYLHKWGAPPAYLLRGRDVQKIGTTSPPPGLGVGETHQAECVRLSLQREHCLILVSDGIAPEAAAACLRSHPGASPQTLAAGIVSRGEPDTDDRSVAVLRLHSFLPQHKHSITPLRNLSKLR